MPTADAASDLAFYEGALGAEIVFAIEAFGTRVARVDLGGGPALLLAEHLEGEAPILVYRVADLEATLADLEVEERFEIPHGPCATLAGRRVALYERTRPEADERLAGRHDFGPEG